MVGEIEYILILTETPLRERDYKRFGIELLSRKFKVLVLDLTKITHPNYWESFHQVRYEFNGYCIIECVEDLIEIVHKFNGKAIAIDYLFAGEIQKLLRTILRNQGILTATVLAGLIPTNSLGRDNLSRFIARSIREFMVKNYRTLRTCFHKFVHLPHDISDISVLAGSHAFSLIRAKTPYQILGHSFDYDLFLELRNQAKQTSPYAIFLDQDLVGHSDRLITGTKNFVSAEKYYPSLNSFFSRIEDQLGIEVKIAGQPKSQYPINHPFSVRQVIQNDTARLVQNAQLVLAHYSTAVSFAVLWRKPIMLLNTDELEKSWVQRYWIDAFQRELKVPLINVDHSANVITAGEEPFSELHGYYHQYQEKYIKMSGTPDLPLWQIFSDAVYELPTITKLA